MLFGVLRVRIGTLLKVMRELAIDDTLRKVRSAYGRLVPNKTRFNRHILAQLYNLFVLPNFVYISPHMYAEKYIFPIWKCFTQTDKKKIRMIYF